jgi:hypothetical protein
LSLAAVPDPDLIARVAEKAHEPATELVVSTAIPKTPEISDWPVDFQYDMVPLYKTTPLD